jgi:hypothetical protein
MQNIPPSKPFELQIAEKSEKEKPGEGTFEALDTKPLKIDKTIRLITYDPKYQRNQAE